MPDDLYRTDILKLPLPGGAPPRPLPEAIAIAAAELRDEDFGASDLLDRIRSALASD